MEYTFQEMPDVHGTGERKVFPKAAHFTQISNETLMEILASRSVYGKGTIEGVVSELTEGLDQFLTNGHSVKVDGLGTFNIALGMRNRTEAECVKEEGERYDTYGVYIKTINFLPDAAWLHRLRSQTELHKVGKVKTLHQSKNTLEERLQLVQQHLDTHPYITVREYMHLAYVPHTRACRELLQFAADPANHIGTKGNGTHKVYVKKR